MTSLKLLRICAKSHTNVRAFQTYPSYSSSRQGIYESRVLQSDRQSPHESAEIISLSKDSRSISIPRSDSFEIPKFFYENDTIEASLNERATINLSCNMHANLPQPPNEAVKAHERPYDAIVSLGEGYAKNDKIISEQQISFQNCDNLTNSLSEDRKLALYLSNEKRFGIKLASSAAELISRGLLNVDTALADQKRIMKQINSAWLAKHELGENSKLQLFLPFSADDDAQIDNDSFRQVFELLEIAQDPLDAQQLQSGSVSCSSLVDRVDEAVRGIVMEYFKTHELPFHRI